MTTEQALGSITITQLGIIVQDIEAKAQAWAEVLGLPVPQIMLTDPYERAHTEYRGEPSEARAKLAFFHLGAGGPGIDRTGRQTEYLARST
jgi:methylmalonyl-CoA/ethylmalonyl-CoA epimerase